MLVTRICGTAEF